jgi:hypothetical protein
MSVAATAGIREVLEPFKGREYVPLPSLAEQIKRVLGADFDRDDRTYAINRGLVEVAPVRGRAGAKQVSQDEARRIALAAVVAVAAGGIAIVTVLSVLKPGLAAGIIRAAQAVIVT